MDGAATDRDELVDLLALLMTPGVGPARLARLLERFGEPAAARRASREALQRVPGVGPKTAAAIASPPPDLAPRLDAELDAIERVGASVIRRSGSGYPALLAPLPDAPPLLMTVGNAPLDTAAAAIVGSRRCTRYGAQQARRFAAALAGAGYTVVSGGARGIDIEAHRAAVDAGGRTVIVLGSGLGVPYPPEHGPIFDELVSTGRATVVSELPVMTPPVADNFPARNRIISGLSLGVIVIEAGERSGALITARLAVEEHGREAMAVPGRVDDPASRGALTLIRAGGAALVIEPGDALELLGPAARLAGATSGASTPAAGLTTAPAAGGHAASASPAVSGSPPGDQDRSPLLALLGEPTTFDTLLDRSGIEAGALRSALTRLEILGLVTREGVTWRRVSP